MIKAKEIRAILKTACPASDFSEYHGAGTTLHYSDCCMAKSDGSFCDCIKHLTHTCLAGEWPQLDFVKEANEVKIAKTAEWLEAAKKAVVQASK